MVLESKLIFHLLHDADVLLWCNCFLLVSTIDYTPPEVSTEELMERLTEIQVEEPPEEEKKDANPDAEKGPKQRKKKEKLERKNPK